MLQIWRFWFSKKKEREICLSLSPEDDWGNRLITLCIELYELRAASVLESHKSKTHKLLKSAKNSKKKKNKDRDVPNL